MNTANTSGKPAAGWRWPVIIVGMLLGHVTLMGWAVTKAVGDRNGTVIPDYYAKSLKWDEEKAAGVKSAALGWKVAVVVGSAAHALGAREAVVSLVDAAGAPVVGAVVEVTYFHESRPADARTVTAVAMGAGSYGAALRVPHSGFFSFSVRATVGADVFVKRWSQYVGG